MRCLVKETPPLRHIAAVRLVAPERLTVYRWDNVMPQGHRSSSKHFVVMENDAYAAAAAAEGTSRRTDTVG